MQSAANVRIKEWVYENVGFSCFLLLQLLILIISASNFFGEKVDMKFDAQNLDISDTAVLVNDDNSISINGQNDAEPFGRWIAGTQPFDLKQGMYEVSVCYESFLYDNELGGNCQDMTGSIQIIKSEDVNTKLCYNEITLNDGQTAKQTRLWIRNPGGEKGLQAKIAFNGIGELKVDSIRIRELVLWRLTKILAWLCCFVTIDVLYIYFFLSKNAKNKSVTAILVLATSFVSLPMLTDMLFWGHDIEFHLCRMIELANGLAAGHIFVPIQMNVLNGYGYAAPLFYSQLFLYPPAILYNMAVPIQVCYQIYVIIINITTCIIAYYGFREMIKDKMIAACGTTVYLLSAYRLTNLLVRAAVGEYTAMAFLPLVVYGFVHIYTKDDAYSIKDYFPIVVGLSGLIESHIISCELSAIFIIAVCIVAFKKTFAARRFMALLKAAALTILVNMAFLYPFLDSMGMDLRVNHSDVNQMQEQGTYLVQVLGGFQVSIGDSVEGMRGEMPLALGIALVIGMLIFCVCCSMRQEWKIEKDGIYYTGIVCVVFAGICVVLSTRFFPWDSIESISRFLAKVLCVVQFPWRYLTMATIFATAATVIGLAIVKEKKGRTVSYILCGILCAVSVMTSGFLMAVFTNETSVKKLYGDAEVDRVAGNGSEYLLNDTVESDFRWRKLNMDERVVAVSNYKYKGGVTTFDCMNASSTEMPLEIPILHYDNYHAYDLETGVEIGIMNGTNNRVSIAVPANFDGTISVKYEFPVTWKIAYGISVLSVVWIMVILIKKLKKEREIRTRGL